MFASSVLNGTDDKISNVLEFRIMLDFFSETLKYTYTKTSKQIVGHYGLRTYTIQLSMTTCKHNDSSC